MKIEMTDIEMFTVFGNLADTATFSIPLKINNQEFVITNYSSYPTGYLGCRVVNLELEKMTRAKSPQEVAAEEAVQKAESALKAAKDVLSKVKEK